jgi:DNA-binding transcriptional regulator GbsR (MarR family)
MHQELHMKLPEVDNRQRMDQLLRTFEFFERWTDKVKKAINNLLQHLSDDEITLCRKYFIVP